MNKSHNSSPIRITSGSLRGRALISPRSAETHPMGSREKLALFNMLIAELPLAAPLTADSPQIKSPQSEFQNLRILDAYAGSGALGIEALSRGAESVVFVEKSAKIAKIIRSNLSKLGLEKQGNVICENIANFVTKNTSKGKSTHNNQFDLILADPPYDYFNPDEISDLATLLTPEGILALSHPGEAPEFKNLTLLKTRSYARAHISLYRHN